MKTIKVGFLGFGNIGQGVYEVLQDNADAIARRYGVRFEIARMLVRDLSKPRRFDAGARLTDNIADIASDPEIELVCEFMGGIHPAREYLLEVLKAGKNVVTANKQVLANCWPELQQAAKGSGAGLSFEASVAGGIPIIRTLTQSMQGNQLDSVMGIINGTTNYILSRMTEEGLDYADVLRSAQELGLAEPDPTSDVEGYDAKYKLSILCSLAFNRHVPLDAIYCEGITKITADDIRYADELGYVIKLLAIGKKKDEKIEARVHPVFVPKSHPLASVRGAFNAVFLHGNAVDDLMLYGRGAGDRPTASAIVSDMVYAANQPVEYMTFPFAEAGQVPEDWESRYYLRVSVSDEPGVMARMTQVFGKWNISISAMFQKESRGGEASLVFVTHKTSEKAMRSMMDELMKEEKVRAITSFIRVEGEDA